MHMLRIGHGSPRSKHLGEVLVVPEALSGRRLVWIGGANRSHILRPRPRPAITYGGQPPRGNHASQVPSADDDVHLLGIGRFAQPPLRWWRAAAQELHREEQVAFPALRPLPQPLA